MIYQECANLPVAPQAVTVDLCATLLKQVRRVLIARTTASAYITPASALILASWTPFLTAATSSKIISIKSLFYAPKINGSDAVKVGSNDNATPDGRSQVVGETVPSFEGMFTGLSNQSFTDIRKLFAEGQASADFDRLGAYIFCGDDQLIMSNTTPAGGGGGNGGPIPIHSPFIGNPEGGELHKLTQCKVSWEFDKEWWSNAIVVKVPFNHNLLVN